MSTETPPPKRFKPDSNASSLSVRVRDCEQVVSELVVTQRAQRKDVINPLVLKVERIDSVLQDLKSKPPPPGHTCLKTEEWSAFERKQEGLMAQGVEHTQKIEALQKSVEKGLQSLERDVQEGIKTRQMVEGLEEEVDEAKSTRKSTWTMFASMILTFGLAAASAIYFVGGLGARVEAAEVQRRDDSQRMTKQIQAVQSKVENVNQPVVQKIEQLASQFKRDTPTMERCFRQLSDRQKGILLRGGTITDPPPGCR